MTRIEEWIQAANDGAQTIQGVGAFRGPKNNQRSQFPNGRN